MSLITETNEEYYAGQHSFVGDGVTTEFPTTFNTDLTLTSSTGNGNFTVTVNGAQVTPAVSTTNPQTVVITPAPINNSIVIVTLSTPAIWNNYGGYSYITLNDLIDNFLVGYVGHGKLVSSAKRTDILFHAKRGEGAFLNGKNIQVSNRESLEECLLATGFPFKQKQALPVYIKCFQDIFQNCSGMRRMGSAAMDLAYVAAGRFDGFWELGLSPWDMAAGSIIIEEAGGNISDFWGKNSYLSNGYLASSNGFIHSDLIQIIQKYFKLD